MRKWLSILTVVVVVLCMCLPAYAEDKQILVAQEETRQPREHEGKAMPGVFIKDVVIEGNTVIATETLEKLTKQYKDRELTLEEMSELTDLITMTYQEKGYILARAYLPEQEITDGILKISIAEGKIGKIKVAGYTHYKSDVIKRYFEQQQQLGVVKESLLEKGLLLSSDTPNVKTTVVLKEGEKPGLVDVILDTKDTSTLTLGVDMSIDYNNFGSDITGEKRFGTAIGFTDHLFGSRLDLRLVSGESYANSGLISTQWTLPINSYGTKISLNYLHANYAVGQELADLNMQGRSQYYGAQISHPFMKKKNMNFNFSLGWTYKFNKNLILNQDRSLDEAREYFVSFNYDSLDRFLGKNIASLGYQWGQVDRDEKLTTSLINTEDVSYDYYRINLARIQKIYGYTNIMLRASGQYSDKRLLPMDQMGLGGYGTVRGYDPSLYLGDSGACFSAELMFAPPFLAENSLFGFRVAQLIQFVLFWDYGQVYTTDAEANDDQHSHYLSGYGGGIRLFYKDWFTFKYDLGIPSDRLEGKPSAFNYVQFSFTLF